MDNDQQKAEALLEQLKMLDPLGEISVFKLGDDTRIRLVNESKTPPENFKDSDIYSVRKVYEKDGDRTVEWQAIIKPRDGRVGQEILLNRNNSKESVEVAKMIYSWKEEAVQGAAQFHP